MSIDQHTTTTVPTDAGLIEGTTGRRDDVRVFRGIPYAAPPVGDLRWRAPQPPAPWDGVRQATRFGAISPQPETAATRALGLGMDEDCLTLNLWTPVSGSDEPKPVLVWIYGGGFQEGSAADPRFDGENLARRGVVVVTFNYRLGALGFLATPELSAESGHDASGNYGLLDCVRALEWVRDNVAAFGGDPGRVTIAGQSAGAGTCNFLAMSPLATGLFHRVIAQSHARHAGDTELRYLSTSYRGRDAAEAQGAAFVAARGATDLDAMRALPFDDLVDRDRLGDMDVETGSDARPPLFRPVVDGWVLPHGYAETYALGAQNRVDYIAGNDLDESGAIPEDAFAATRAKGEQPWRPGRPPTHVTLESFTRGAHEKFGPLADEFLALYPATDDDEAALASNDAIHDNATVSTSLWGTTWTAECERPVRTYFWTHRPPSPSGGPRRAGHGSEIDFVFDNLDVVDLDWDDDDRAVAATMSAYWVNYIATGDPNGPGLPAWPEYAATPPTVMDLGTDFAMRPVATPERTAFWERFFRTQVAW
ncbi:carboxylesterase 2 [Curtobacterium sp. PhB130]|uniref:carboxylesterase/lipase family protein n=1 Tax=Curtobacterium sp. PhB130 TaxID=2485178 RepID=UPI000F4C3CEE|nr:carboxylesterase family protein [Curtobacterium sp. PhB130]ROS74646.1 carboxylesterase 2 [Curtobacterium sp. PhB130]